MLAQDYIPYPGENQFIGYIKANYSDLFPDLITQSQFNRRARNLRLLVEEMRRHWLQELGLLSQVDLLLDTKPVPVMGYKRSKRCSDFAGSADYGVCASRNLKYYGYKLVSLCTLDGIPIVYELVSANTDERLAAESVLYALRSCHIYADKGFIGEDWQKRIFGIPATAFTQLNELIKWIKIQSLLIAGSTASEKGLKVSSMKSRILEEISNAY